KVIRSIRSRQNGESTVKPAPPKAVVKPPDVIKPAYKSFVPGGVIVIGASTGGPVALRELLGGVSAEIPAAIVIVQHMPASFTDVLAEQLNRHTPLPVKEAAFGDQLKAGVVYVAPGDQHLLIDSSSRVQLNRGPKIRGHRPAVDVTMQSVSQIYGARTKGVVLTGMGDDGTEGMVAIRAKGGKTFAQDAETSVVNGMPQRARDRGVVDIVATPLDLAEHLMRSFSTYSR
ncbi:MAG: chemotaxis protein CheB, partial [Candidatus Promineifilaceae bacterium]